MNSNDWINLLTIRPDLSDKLIHLTKSTHPVRKSSDANDVLFTILSSHTLLAHRSLTSHDKEVVCFQDTPISAIAQMSYAWKNKTLFQDSPRNEQYLDSLKRYEGFGIRIDKKLAYDKGARPVFYLATKSDEKDQIKMKYQWKTVRFELENENNFIDWSHEREWLYHKTFSPDKTKDFTFNYSDIEIIVPRYKDREKLIERCIEENKTEIIKSCKGILVLESILN